MISLNLTWFFPVSKILSHQTKWLIRKTVCFELVSDRRRESKALLMSVDSGPIYWLESKACFKLSVTAESVVLQLFFFLRAESISLAT